MESRVMLCVDGQSLRNPVMVGLEGEPLESFPWLKCVTDAEQCRAAYQEARGIEEAWIVSCDDMDPINVAAALKRDRPDGRVYLVVCGQSGSLASRVAQAHVDGLWSESFFLKRYAQAKRVFASSGGSQRTALIAERPLSTQKALPESGADQPESMNNEERTSRHARPAPVQKRRLGGSHAAPGARVIAVVSGSGGCGKSTLSALFACMAARAGFSTVLLDADLQFGDTCHLLGVHEPLRIEEVIEEPSRMGRMREELKRGVPAVLAAPRRLESAEAAISELPQILQAMREDYEVVVVNTGSFWSEIHALVLEKADAVAFVVDQRPSSLRATVHAVELCARLGIATGSFNYAVNRHERESLLSAVDVSCALRGAHATELPNGGRIVDELLGAGYPGELLDAESPFVEAAERFLMRLLPPEMASAFEKEKVPARKKRPLFGRGGKA